MINCKQVETAISQRHDHTTWDICNIKIAMECAKRSKDPSTQVGAVIVDSNNRIKATGYNGLPIGLKDTDVSWSRTGGLLESKYALIVHAEVNAILSAKTDLSNCKIYVTLFPCHECAKVIIQSGITQVIYLEDKYAKEDSIVMAKRLFDTTGVNYRKLIL